MSTPSPSTEASARITDSQLSVLLRQAQWALDDAAHDVPAGRTTVERRVELAGTLEALAVVLRASAPDHAEHPVSEPGVEKLRGCCTAGAGTR